MTHGFENNMKQEIVVLEDFYAEEEEDGYSLDVDMEKFGNLPEGSYIVTGDSFLECVSEVTSTTDHEYSRSRPSGLHKGETDSAFGHLSCRHYVESLNLDDTEDQFNESLDNENDFDLFDTFSNDTSGNTVCTKQIADPSDNQVVQTQQQNQWSLVEENAQLEVEDSKVNGALECRWDNCWWLFKTQKELVRHIESQHVENKRGDDYPCQWQNCPRRIRPFNARYKLLIHMRVHSGEKPNKCLYPGCKKAFSRLENLKIHRRSHTGEKPYACTFTECEKAFSNSSDRAKHQRTHFNTKPYACTVDGCEKRYTDPSSLRKHIKHHSNTSLLPETPKKLVRMASEPIVSKAELESRGLTRSRTSSQSASIWSEDTEVSSTFFDNEDSLTGSINSEIEREFLDFAHLNTSTLVPIKMEDLDEYLLDEFY